MIRLLRLSAADLQAALPMPAAIEAMKAAYAALARGRVSAPPRGVVACPERRGTTLVMGADVPGEGLAAKVVSIFHRNTERQRAVVNGLVLVLDPETGEPAALLDGTFLTAWRTGAASGAATDLLARADARVGAVIGCGAQARTQVRALDCARPLEQIRIYGRRRERAARLAAELGGEVRAPLVVVESAAAAVRGADVVCAATSSAQPVFDGAWLREGAHVNAIGSFTPAMQELDRDTVRRARVFVDQVAAAAEEAGELIAAERAGATRRADWVEIGRVAAGEHPGRRDAAEITLFKSVGHAVQDVVAGARAVTAARRLGLGKQLEI